MSDSSEPELTRVQIQLTHLAHEHEQLNAVVVDQSKTIAALERLVRTLQRRVDRLEVAGGDGEAEPEGDLGEEVG